MAENFPQIIVRHQNTDPRGLDNTKQNKSQKKPQKTYTCANHFQTTENQRQRKNAERSQRKKHLTYRGEKIRITSNFSSEIMQAKYEIFEVLKEKKPTNLEFCTLPNYSSKAKEKYFLRQRDSKRTSGCQELGGGKDDQMEDF